MYLKPSTPCRIRHLDHVSGRHPALLFNLTENPVIFVVDNTLWEGAKCINIDSGSSVMLRPASSGTQARLCGDPTLLPDRADCHFF